MAQRLEPTVLLAAISPITIALVAGAAALTLLLSGSLIAAIVVSIAVYVLRVLVSHRIAAHVATLPRRIDPFALREPWRFFVRDAIRAQTRFTEALTDTEPGPLRDRLLEIGESLDDGVEQAWKAAQRGQQLTDARRRIDGPQLQCQLEGLDAADPRRSGLEAQLATHVRLAGREERTRTELESLDVRLDEAVARVTELGTRAGGVAELDKVAASIGDVVRELEALRLGLDDIEGAA